MANVYKKRYRCIVKVGNDQFVKYRCTYPDKLIDFLKSKFPDLRYANFFHGRGPLKGKQCLSWGKNSGFKNFNL